jgi:hypothetical protein
MHLLSIIVLVIYLAITFLSFRLSFKMARTKQTVYKSTREWIPMRSVYGGKKALRKQLIAKAGIKTVARKAPPKKGPALRIHEEHVLLLSLSLSPLVGTTVLEQLA